jgi:autotransporter-associated beta strand protein
LVIAGGVVDLNGADFLAPLGTGPGQVQFTGSGGFSGYSPLNHPPASSLFRVVNLGGQSTQVAWGSGGFVPDGATLILGFPSVDGVPFMGFMKGTTSLDFQNPIDLGNSMRNIQAGTTDNYVDFLFNVQTISGALSGSGGVIKSGQGLLKLAAANTYTGETRVAGGVLELADPLALPGGIDPTGGTSHLLVTGGGRIRLNAGAFRRNLGSGPDGVQFSGSGGFSGGADPVVNLGGASAPVVWDNNPYLPDNFELILENPGFAGPVDFQNPLVLGSGKRKISTFYGSGDTHARLSGSISGVGGLKKDGGLVLELAAANSYTGETDVSAGILRLSHSNALPGGIGLVGGTSNLNFTGSNSYSDVNGISEPLSYYYSSGSVCVVELASGDFTRGLGTGPSQVQFTGSGGFSAYGATRAVNLGGASQTVTWGANSFVPTYYKLCLSSKFSNATVDFQNPIDFGSAVRTVFVADGTALVDGKLSGRLSGTGGLEKSGDGTLELTSANTYTGQTKVSRGALRLSNPQALPGGTGTSGGLSNLIISSGGGSVVELAAGDLLRGLGTGPSQVQFSYSYGGFAAVGAERIVNFGGNSAPLTWGQNYFTPFTLVLGSKSANATVDFQNPINFGANWASVQIDRGSAPVDAKLSGVLSGTGNIDKNGDGTLQLTAGNTYSGKINVWAGKLLVDGALSQNSTVVVQGSATLGGIGSIGNVEIALGGTLAPGDSAGVLSLSGNLTLDAGASLDFDLGPTAISDKIAMSNSTLILNYQKFSDFGFNTLAGFSAGTYVLIDAGTVQGSLNAADNGSISGLPAMLSVSGNDLVLTVVPEPSSFVLLAIGAACAIAFRKRWRRKICLP